MWARQISDRKKFTYPFPPTSSNESDEDETNDTNVEAWPQWTNACEMGRRFDRCKNTTDEYWSLTNSVDGTRCQRCVVIASVCFADESSTILINRPFFIIYSYSYLVSSSSKWL